MNTTHSMLRLTVLAIAMAGLSACAANRCKNDAPYTRAVAYPPLESAGAVSAPTPSQEFQIPPAPDGQQPIAVTESGCLDRPPRLDTGDAPADTNQG